MGDYRPWLDSLGPWRAGDSAEVQDALALSSKLWGDPENLKRQLLAPSPEIPPVLDLKGLRTLLAFAGLGVRFGNWMPTPGIPERTRIIVGGRQFTVHEAQYEIVRRAIDSTELS